MHYMECTNMFLPKLTFIRGMARRVKTSKKFQLQPNVLHPPSKGSISHGDKEIIIDHRLRTTTHIHHDLKSEHTFQSLKLRNDVQMGLQTLKISLPTIIQIQGIPLVLDRKNVFCAAQTGSGKTLVYAAPIINMLRDSFDKGFIGRLSRPRALVVAPSRELAEQILAVFKSFSSVAPFRSLGLIGQAQKKWKREYLKGLVDVIVATPEIIVKYQKKGHVIFSDLEYLVLDEADTLFDENFREITKSILNFCHFHESGILSSKKNVQGILTAATLPPKGILNSYKSYIPDLQLCQSNLHKVLPNVKHSFLKTDQKEKIALLVDKLLEQVHKNTGRCIVFCNTSKSCNWVSIKLDEHDLDHTKLHGNVPPKERTQNYEKFVNGDHEILVCTDVASRGLDITDVTLVINFDCPFNASDYIHRSGRTGRATEVHSGKGEVLTFVTQNKEVLFAEKVQTAAEKNESLDGITSKRNPLQVQHKKEMENYLQSVQKVKGIKPVKGIGGRRISKMKDNKSFTKI